jgi:hypothetical protein
VLHLDELIKMENVKYLEFQTQISTCSNAAKGLEKKLSSSLSLLYWRDEMKEGSSDRDLLPINLKETKKLAILKLSHVKVPDEFSEALGSPETINLHTLSLCEVEGIHRLPTHFGGLSGLVKLECKNLGLSELPESFGTLSSL